MPRHSDDDGVILNPRQRTAKLTEREHFEQLVNSLKKFREHVAKREWDAGYLKDAVQHCSGIGFYRNDNRWYRLAAMIDEVAKKPPKPYELVHNILKQIDGIIYSVNRLMNKKGALH